ncbi:MAG: enoyl-CoA hydratase-related protein [Myxococcota bacterium]
MSAASLVRTEIRGRAAWLTLASPRNRNALSAAMIEALEAYLHEFGADPELRAIVLTGEGRAFCSGADLKGGAAAGEMTPGEEHPFVRLLRCIWEGPKPVIAAVNGPAYGGGIGLVAASDIAIAADEARFAFNEVRVGVIPALISVVVLPKIGVQETMRLFLTGARFDAAEARAHGLVHRVVPLVRLHEAVEEELDLIAQGGPRAVSEAKRLVREVSRLPEEEAFRLAAERIRELFASDEAAEGMAAFLEKRPAAWTR